RISDLRVGTHRARRRGREVAAGARRRGVGPGRPAPFLRQSRPYGRGRLLGRAACAHRRALNIEPEEISVRLVGSRPAHCAIPPRHRSFRMLGISSPPRRPSRTARSTSGVETGTSTRPTRRPACSNGSSPPATSSTPRPRWSNVRPTSAAGTATPTRATRNRANSGGRSRAARTTPSTIKSGSSPRPQSWDGTVYAGTSDSSRLMALDARTGRLRFNFDNGKLYAVDAKTGKLAWEFQTEA